MSEDELLALYGSMKEMAAAMKAREAALEARTVALSASIDELKGLPLALGKQTSQYIAMGIRQSIADDFSRPIAEAVKEPLAELSRETYHARDLMAQIGKEVRFQSWRVATLFVLLGFALGGATGYYFFVQDLNRIDSRLDSLQQSAQPAPVPTLEAKPMPGGKGKKGH